MKMMIPILGLVIGQEELGVTVVLGHQVELLAAECYRTFNVDNPTSASMHATIQKRMTMVGSFQPSFSK
jgi:hypothetical protein